MLSADMLVLDASHDMSVSEPMSQFFNRRPRTDCTLRLSDSDSDTPISYAELALAVGPLFRSMEEEYIGGSVQSSRCTLMSASYPSGDHVTRTLKLMALVRHADGRPPVMIAVQYFGTMMQGPSSWHVPAQSAGTVTSYTHSFRP